MKSAGSVGVLGRKLQESGLTAVERIEFVRKTPALQLPLEMRGKAAQDKTEIRLLDRLPEVQHQLVACGLQTPQFREDTPKGILLFTQ
ncbi:MAG: hypothetical protein A2Y76_04655 [Planctomycetes bacterium RBG_13_60_9]|nr:MAG: hypothetical protein A2Y76_04655 [Planctomycetes bacterium RBG_13_60_9]